MLFSNTSFKWLGLLTVVVGLSLPECFADETSRLDHLIWTDRNVSNPPLSRPASTINESIERFWNLPDTSTTSAQVHGVAHQCQPPSSYSQPCRPIHPNRQYCQSPQPRANNHLSQDQQSHERRGYLGINLFNVIPLIDIVHGSSESSSSDHVEASK